MHRTHTCGELRAADAGAIVTLAGWIDTIRTHGNVTFVDLRDRYGVTQLVFKEEVDLPRESVIKVSGTVEKKPEPNKKLATGEIEIQIDAHEVISKAQTLPIDENATEETRLKYRYLDLRRKEMQDKLVLRSKVTKAARDYCDEHEFIEIETPLLMKSTPEGARDYVVPSRVNKGSFYALPQSPQLYKQILMVAGFDKYYQFARCLRDEDLRADRQPEHTQIDLEMSFVHQEDILQFTEGMMKHVFKEALGVELEDFPVLTYAEAMSRFGSDKPDIRFGLELKDITATAQKSSFNAFKNAEATYCIACPHEISGKKARKLEDTAKIHHAKGLAYATVTNGKLEGGISKFLPEDEQEAFIKASQAKEGDTLLMVADKPRIAQTALGQVRLQLRDEYEDVKADDFKFCWVVDFPLFSYNEEEERWEPEHHMFTMPKEEYVKDFEKRPQEVLGDLYDLALNGYELGSGSIRVTKPEIQERIMNFIGFSKEEAQDKFGFLLEAYTYGGPTHGGIALGVDRIVALMLGIGDIREVIAFPKNKRAENPMDGSPGSISERQLEELGIKLR